MNYSHRMHHTIKNKISSSSATVEKRSNQVIHVKIRPNLKKNEFHSNFNGKINPLRENSQEHFPKYRNSKEELGQGSFNGQNLSERINFKNLNLWSDRRGTINDLCEERKKNKRKRAFYLHCCQCSYLCILLSLCCTVLLAASIAALIVGLLIQNSKVTTTTTAKSTVSLTSKNEVIYGVWNTTVGQDSILSTPGNTSGNYNPNETPQNVFDQNITTKYTSYGICNRASIDSSQCGLNTGLYLTLQRGAALLTAIRFCTANARSERDPITITIEGSNQVLSALLLGSSWILIYGDSSGLDSDPGRSNYGVMQTISNNLVAYNSYRLLITSIRNESNSVSYSEIELYGS